MPSYHIIHIPLSLYSMAIDNTDNSPRIMTVWCLNNLSVFCLNIGNEDYDMTPNPSILTIRRGQEMACSNITIHDDGIVERIEIFHVTVGIVNSTFSAGVNLTQSTSTVEIKDNDGELSTLLMTIHSPNETIHAVKWFKII